MKKEFAMSLSQSYRQDLLDAIQLAEQGLLSPSQQAYCFEEIGDTKGTAFYPANGDELLWKLRTALGEKAQISERQRAEGELHKLGVELLFHIYINRFIFAEITHNTAAHKYPFQPVPMYNHPAGYRYAGGPYPHRLLLQVSRPFGGFVHHYGQRRGRGSHRTGN